VKVTVKERPGGPPPPPGGGAPPPEEETPVGWLTSSTFGIPNWLLVASLIGAVAISGFMIMEEERRRELLTLVALRRR